MPRCEQMMRLFLHFEVLCMHTRTCTLQVAALIVGEDPATLAPGTAASPAFRDFLCAALVKKPELRPSAAELAEHEWIKGAERAPLAQLLAEQEALKQAGGGGGGAADPGGGGTGSEDGTLLLDKGGGADSEDGSNNDTLIVHKDKDINEDGDSEDGGTLPCR